MLKHTDCRHCKKEASPSNFHGEKSKELYLFKCSKNNCQKFFWHRNVLEEFNLQEPDSDKNKEIETNLIKRLKIPESDGSDGKNVYVIKLSRKKKEKKDSVYVGETSLHPLQRYLNHIRGYKSSRHVKNRGKYLLYFELNVKDSIKREKELGKELEDKYIVYGPSKER